MTNRLLSLGILLWKWPAGAWMLPPVFNLLPTDMGVVVRSNPCGLEDDPTLRIRGNHPLQQFVSNPGPLVIRVNCQIAPVGRVRAVSDATQHTHESVPIQRRQDNIRALEHAAH